MEALLAPLRFALRIFSKRTSENNRTITGGDIHGDSNVVTYDQSINPSITINSQPNATNQQLRVEAAHAVWTSLITIKSLRTTAIDLLDLAYPHSRDNYDQFSRYPGFVAAKAELTIEKLGQHSRAKDEAQKYKPHIPDRLWQLLHAYHLVKVRPCLILTTEEEVQVTRWWKDQLIQQAFSAPNMPDRLRQFIPPADSPRNRTLDLIEEEIQKEIRAITGSAAPSQDHPGT